MANLFQAFRPTTLSSITRSFQQRNISTMGEKSAAFFDAVKVCSLSCIDQAETDHR
jgi:hypothetical protein